MHVTECDISFLSLKFMYLFMFMAFPIERVNYLCKKKVFVAFPWVVTSTGPGGFMMFAFII